MIRVLLVDDQALVRSGFRIILESEPDIEVVGEAANGAEAVELAASLAPDVICMDVEMPELNGIEASRRILGGVAPAGGAPIGAETAEAGASTATPRRGPAVLILTTFGHEAYLFDALAAGVSGFLLKTSRAEQLIDAVRALAAGQALLGPDVTQAVLARLAGAESGRGAATTTAATGAATAAAPADASTGVTAAGTTGTGALGALDTTSLTEREREVLHLVAAGRSNGEIAAELFLGEATVKTHVSNLLQKLGARDRLQLVVWAHTGPAGR